MKYDKRHANEILDRVRDGQLVAPTAVTAALVATGDAPRRSAGVDQAIQEKSDGGGESRSISMVAENLIRLSEKAWSTRR